jgi:signal transduction histidine kinase
VSAIVIQAQAGTTLAATDPDAAVRALHVIEQEATRTLREMRIMVSALRQGDDPTLSPQCGVEDLHRLVREDGAAPQVRIQLSPGLDDLRPSLSSAIYRLAQESITNAVRHARNASRVDVTVEADDDEIRLVVLDDGTTSTYDPSATVGYGLLGMAERASLMGGSLNAGPRPAGGWSVTAVLPRSGRRS